jgi:hypothetical protein
MKEKSITKKTKENVLKINSSSLSKQFVLVQVQ